MKPILLFLAGIALACQAPGQTTITGTLMEASGAPANCTLTIKPLNVPGASTTTISYVIVGGDLTGTTGGFGTPRHLRLAALQLMPGVYSTLESCSDFGTRTRTWNVPNAASVTVGSLNGGLAVAPQPPTSGTYCLTSVNGAYGVWGACGGSSPSFAGWDLLTGAWDSYTAGWDTYH